MIKNSWSSSIGHSAGYWAGRHSIIDEMSICPCEASARTWIPANRTCMLAARSPLTCAGGAKKYVRDKWVFGATPLVCNTAALDPKKADLLGWTGCNPDLVYVLAESVEQPGTAWTTIPAGSDGYLRFHLVGWNPKDPGAAAIDVETDESSWYGIENLLRPQAIVGNSETDCGVFFWPYETFLEATATYRTIHDTPAVSWFGVKWSDSSYLKKRTGDRRYDLLEKSTHKFKALNFTGPYPM